jgi:hypothetical protein
VLNHGCRKVWALNRGLIVNDLHRFVDRPFLAGLRRCPPQFARPRPAIERGRTRPRPAKLDDDLDRRLLADLCRTLADSCGRGRRTVRKPLHSCLDAGQIARRSCRGTNGRANRATISSPAASTTCSPA